MLDSTELVREMLLNFHAGHGCYISNEYCTIIETDKRDYEGFRDHLTSQLHALLGVKPRWESPTKKDSRYCVFYP